MNVYNMADNITREQFLIKTKGLCPSSFGIIDFHLNNDGCNKFDDCPDCRKYAIKDIKFKGDEKNKWVFNLEEFKKGNITIHCKTEEEYNELIINLKYYNFDFPKNSQMYNGETCYRFYENGLYQASYKYYEEKKYTIYNFSEIDFSQVLCKKDIDNIALNYVNNFDITKTKYITKEQLEYRGYKTGDILFDGESMTIIYGNKTLHINTNCVETLNPKAFDYILPIELIESDSEIQRLLSGKLSEKISQSYLVDYFIKIEEPPKTKAICSVKFTVNADCPKDFILEDDSEVIAVNDIVEANTSGKNYQYAKVVEVNTLELSEHEINNYRTCRKLSN